jgi:hypothetical protein
MKKLLLISFLSLFSAAAHAANLLPLQSFCEVGGQTVSLSGLSSTTTVQQSFPSCTVTVYLTGTTTLATIYSDANSTALSNPFTANANGYWLFYTSNSACYDVVTSGGTSPNVFSTAFTRTDLCPGGGGSGTVPAGKGQPQYSDGTGTLLLASPQEFFNTSVAAGTTGDMTALIQADLDKIGCRIFNGTIPSAVYHLPIGMPNGVQVSQLYVPSDIVVQPPSWGSWFGQDKVVNDSTVQAVQAISVQSQGTSYTSAPTVTITPSIYGSGATATATIGNVVQSVSVTAGGTGYSPPPTVNITGGGGSGATATATVRNGVITAVTVTAQGTGFTSAPTISFSGATGSGASAVASISGGRLVTVTMSAGGTNYGPSVAFSTGNAVAYATVNASGVVTAITVTSGGSLYSTVPTVSITGGGGSGATATATTSGGQLLNVTVTAGGTNYTYADPPAVTFTGGGGSGAAAYAEIGTTGSVINVHITAAGTNYTSSPTVVFTSGSGAAATATVSGGAVTAVTVGTAGTGYSGPPTVTFTGGGGTGAQATALVSGGAITSVVINAAGSGYTTAPTVAFVPGSGATAVAQVGIPGGLYSVSVTAGGTSYYPVPTVSFSGGGGSGATATASTYTLGGGTAALIASYAYVTNCTEYAQTNVPLGGSNVTIRGYNIYGNNAGGADIGIYTVGSHDLIENVTVQSTGGQGVYLSGQDSEVVDPFTTNTLLYMRTAPKSQFSGFVGSIDLVGLDSKMTGGEVSTGSPFVTGGKSSSYPYDVAVHVSGGGAYVSGVLAQVSDVDYGVDGLSNRLVGNRADFTADSGYINYGGDSTFVGNTGQGNCTYISNYDGCIAINSESSFGGNTYSANTVVASGGYGPSYYTASFGDGGDSWTGNIPATYPSSTDTTGNNLVVADTISVAEGGGPGFVPVPHTCNVTAGTTAPNCNGSDSIVFADSNPTLITGLYYPSPGRIGVYGTSKDFIAGSGGYNCIYGECTFLVCNQYPLALNTSNPFTFVVNLKGVQQSCQAQDVPQWIVNGVSLGTTAYTNNGNLFEVNGDAHVYRIPNSGVMTQTSGGTGTTGTYSYRAKYTYGAHSLTSSADVTVGVTPGNGNNYVNIFLNPTGGWGTAYIYRSAVQSGQGLSTGLICTFTAPQVSGTACTDTGQTATGSVPALGLNDTGALAIDVVSPTPTSGSCTEAGALYSTDTLLYRCSSGLVWQKYTSTGWVTL